MNVKILHNKSFIFILCFLSCLIKCSYTLNEHPSLSLVFNKDRNETNLNTRIIGGSEVPKNSYPFQALLIANYLFGPNICGGTLLSNQWVLTAAHCLPGSAPIEVILGVHDVTKNESTQQRFISTEFIRHKKFNSSLFLNDIALVRLPRNVTFNDYIQPVQLDLTNKTFENERGIVIGWDAVYARAESSVLRHVNVSIMSNAQCAEDEYYRRYITDSHMCTLGNGFVGTCYRDAGGPLLYNGSQIGIVSFGYSSCLIGKPSAYTRLSHFAGWISENIVINNNTAHTNFGSFLICMLSIFIVCVYK